MGYGIKQEKDSASLSYVAKLTDEVWFLMIDVNGNNAKGFIKSDTLTWIEDQLKQANQAKATVIGVSHQNLFIHHELFKFGNQILDAEKIIELFKKYGVKLHFSGHMHMQHILELDGVTDIVSSSIAVSPNQFGVLEIAEDVSMSYKTVPVDVKKWALENKDDDNLLNFANYSREFLNLSTKHKVINTLNNKNISDEERKKMLDFAVEVNQLYFAGKLSDMYRNKDEYALWKEKAENDFFAVYMEKMLEQPLFDMNFWSSGK